MKTTQTPIVTAMAVNRKVRGLDMVFGMSKAVLSI
jgi:hypothetical protein